MDASYDLIKAIFTRLKADAAVTALVDQKVYDQVPQRTEKADSLSFPYVSLGPTSMVPDDFDCLDGEEITIQLDVWSLGSGEAHSTVECRKICDAIKRSLHEAEFDLEANALVCINHELTRILVEQDPPIKHGVIQFTATVELS